ncbi:hypothetical protein V8C44DRAFT_319399 [Trichoderma aethiopicum]
MPGLLRTQMQEQRPLVQPVDDKLVGVHARVEWSMSVTQNFSPCTPVRTKRGPPCLIPTSLVSRENSSTATSSMATAKRQMLRSQTCLIRLASSVARCQFGENHQQCSEPSDGWLIWEDVAKQPLNPSMLIPSLLLIAG